MKAGSQCSVMGKVINLIKLFDILFTVVPVIELTLGLFEQFPIGASLYFEKNIIRNIKTIDEALIVESAPIDISRQLKVECMGQF